MTNDIHIWIKNFYSCTNSNEAFNCLSYDEKNRANSYAFDYLRDEFIICRSTLRKVLGEFLNRSPSDICFSYSEYGKPYLSPKISSCYFNVSHSKEYFAIAISDVCMGVDIEYCQKDLELLQIAKEVFTSNEMTKLSILSKEKQLHEFYKMWTIKEACIKALGTGFNFDPKLFEIDDRFHNFRTLNCNKYKDLSDLYFTQESLNPEYSFALVTPLLKPNLVFH